MAHAEKCPICYGSGEFVIQNRYNYLITHPKVSKIPEPKICHGCNGRGWIEVADEPEPLIQMDILGKAHKVG